MWFFDVDSQIIWGCFVKKSEGDNYEIKNFFGIAVPENAMGFKMPRIVIFGVEYSFWWKKPLFR